jgi:hypothetical protein
MNALDGKRMKNALNERGHLVVVVHHEHVQGFEVPVLQQALLSRAAKRGPSRQGPAHHSYTVWSTKK